MPPATPSDQQDPSRRKRKYSEISQFKLNAEME